MHLKQPLKKVLSALWVQLSKLELFIISVATALVVLAIVSEVILRYFVHKPIMGLEEMAGYTIVWAYFIGGAYAAYERSHIKAEMIHLLLKPRSLRLVRLAGCIITLGLSCYACTWAHEYFVWGITRGQTSLPPWDFRMVYWQSAIYCGLILMSIYFLIEVIDIAHTILRGE